MEFLELVLISIALVIVAVAGLGVRLLLVKDGKFSGGSCSSSPGLESRGISCACGGEDSCDDKTEKVRAGS